MQTTMTSTIPLDSTTINANVIDGIAIITYTCTFTNKQSFPINPIHYISLDDNAIPNNLRMRVGERFLTSNIKEKTVATAEYKQAVDDGKLASLFDKISDTEYKLQVGNVLPTETVEIIITYVYVLSCNTNNAFELVMPTNIAVKYDNKNTANEIDNEYRKSTSLLTHVADKQPYTYNMNITWKTATEFLDLVANNDLCTITKIGEQEMQITATTYPSNGDFIVYAKTNHRPSVYYFDDVEAGERYMLSCLKVNEPITTTLKPKCYNLILDCSGSMFSQFGSKGDSKQKIDCLKHATKVFLNKLSPTDLINITLFGSTHFSANSKNIYATTDNIAKLITFVENLKNMGGTEIQTCIECSFAELYEVSATNFVPLSTPKNTNNNEICEKIIVVITDGQISNTQSLFNKINEMKVLHNKFNEALSENSTNHYSFRIFGIGIGDDVDRRLVKKMSVLTGGDFVCVNNGVSLEKNVMHVINTINTKHYLNGKLICGNNESPPHSHIDVLYANKNHTFVLKGKIADMMGNATVSCFDASRNTILNCLVKKENFVQSDATVRQIFYNMEIKKMCDSILYDYLDASAVKELEKQIIKTSCEHSVMSKYTSFLIVDDVARIAGTKEKGIDVAVPQFCSFGGSGNQECASLPANYQILHNPVPTDPNAIPILRSIPVSSTLGSTYNMNYNISANPPNPKTVVSPFLNSSIMPNIYTSRMMDSREECCDALEGGMCMFGGSSSHPEKKNTIELNDIIASHCSTTNKDFTVDARFMPDIDYAKIMQTTVVPISDIQTLFNIIVFMLIHKTHTTEHAKKILQHLLAKQSTLIPATFLQVLHYYEKAVKEIRVTNNGFGGGGDY
jgi:hypothetical protein